MKVHIIRGVTQALAPRAWFLTAILVLKDEATVQQQLGGSHEIHLENICYTED